MGRVLISGFRYVCTDLLCSLRELDIEPTRRPSPRVNVVPVIGKVDSFTPAELAEPKKLVMEGIEHYRIPVYYFPYDIKEDDEDTVEENVESRSLMPFTIVSSEEVVEIRGTPGQSTVSRRVDGAYSMF
ncbi:hypothetical protein MMC22_009789 [Lobaria immixta]|nr:hypothetical protein [Lobaria immixta]